MGLGRRRLPPKKINLLPILIFVVLRPAGDSREASDDSNKGQLIVSFIASLESCSLYVRLRNFLRAERSVDLPRGRARPEPEAPLVVAERAERRALARLARAQATAPQSFLLLVPRRRPKQFQ